MSFLAPWALALGVAAAAAVVALHLLSTRRPPTAPLPTARFVPVNEARAVSRSAVPTDLPLLLARALAALLLGAAFARPVLDAPGPAVRSVVLLDRSAGVADARAAAAAAREALTEGGAVIVFDTSARAWPADSLDALPAAAPAARDTLAGPDAAPEAAPPPAARPARGILSAAFVAARRAGERLAAGADSVRLVLVSPVAAEELDAATEAMRRAWPGGVTLVRVAAAADTAPGRTARLDSPLADDPLAPALARLGAVRGGHEVRVVRVVRDGAEARTGTVLLRWSLAEDAEFRPDAVTAFGAHAATLVAPLARLPLDTAGAARVVARWRDGAPAVTERGTGAGCVRDVGVGLPLAGDLTLRPAFSAFLAVLAEPCGGARGAAVPDSLVPWLAGDGAAAPATALAAGAQADGRLAAWLLALALLALGAEWLLRRRGRA